MSNPQVVVDFVSNTTGLSSGMKQAGAGAQGFGSKLKGLARAGVVAGGAAGLAALTGTLKVGIDELSQSSKVAAQTAAVIKSTGGAAGVTAKQVGDLAGSMMKKTGIDDEAIQSGENLLLTFTKVQNKAGKGNDIFNRATHVMADMSVALGQDMKSSAIQLGKALNDPIKGVTALQRVGVSFTAGQKKQIKAMVDSGNVMGAQKLILNELNKEFGGSAEAAGKTLPGQINILKESFNNLAGQLVSTLVPALSAVTKFFVDNPGLAKMMVIGILALSAAMVALNAVLAITAVVTGPITLTMVAIAAGIAVVIAAAILLWKNWDTVTRALGAAWNWMKGIALDAFNAVRIAVQAGFQAIQSIIQSVLNWIKANWPLLLGILLGPVALAVAAITTHWSTIRSVTTAAWNAIRSLTVSVWSAIQSFISGVVGALSGAVNSAWNTIRGATSAAWNAVHSSVSNVVGQIKNTLSSLASWVSGFASGVLHTAMSKVMNVFDLISNGAAAAKNAVVGTLDSMVRFIEGIVGSVSRAASSVAGAIKGPINSVLSAWNGISFTIPHITIPSVKIAGKKIGGGSFGGGSFGVPHIPLLAKGGVVDQATLAVVGEGTGREIIAPETLLRQLLAETRPSVRVFIGDTELRGLVRAEVTDVNTGIARTLLAGGA